MTGKAYIGRADGEIKLIAFQDNDTINDLITRAGITLAQGEEVQDDNTEKVTLTSTPDDEATYYIVKNLKNAY